MTVRYEVTVASPDRLDVREFSVHQSMSSLFTVTVTAVSRNPDLDFEAIIGKEGSFTLHGQSVDGAPRRWHGVVSELHQLAVEAAGLSTYHLRIVPKLWLASQRRNHRIFQGMTELDIALQILGEWEVPVEKRTQGQYKSRKYRVQYGETDFTFLARLLEEAGISFYFAEQGEDTVCVLSDAPQTNDERGKPIQFYAEPNLSPGKEHVTNVRLSRHVRPGKVTLRDHDYRHPADFALGASASAEGVEAKLESFHYVPGAFLFESEKGEATPFADDRWKHRTDEQEGAKLTEKRLHATRSDASVAAFHTNVVDLAPGTVMRVLDHPAREVGDQKKLLVLESRIDGRVDGEPLPPVRGPRRRPAVPPAPPAGEAEGAGRGVRYRRRAPGRGDPHRRVRARARAVPLGPPGPARPEELVLDPRQPAVGRRGLRREQPAAHRSGGHRRLPRRRPRPPRDHRPRLHQPAEDALQAPGAEDPERLEEQLVAHQRGIQRGSCSRTPPAASSSTCAPRRT